jgi:hypothetical protein
MIFDKRYVGYGVCSKACWEAQRKRDEPDRQGRMHRRAIWPAGMFGRFFPLQGATAPHQPSALQ